MQAEDRPIHFSSELIHAPKPLHVPALQRLYFELSQTRAAYMNTDFSPQAPPRFHSRRGRQSQSLLVFLPDRLLVAEEWVDLSFRDFLDRLDTVAHHAIPLLELGAIQAQVGTVRTTFALTHFQDARAFLLERVCAQEGRLAPFLARPVAVGGLRFVLPATPEHPGNLHVTIESYQRSRNEVYVEVKGIYLNQNITADNASQLSENLKRVRDFISQSVQPYLAQFDLSTGARD
ncbi:MAG: hypothetical protein IT364_24845 [Candidatus Hydrogenedentes bacterium]|nr:hypothetical protein [Candidatus Hydrogenedentota bacterium]